MKINVKHIYENRVSEMAELKTLGDFKNFKFMHFFRYNMRLFMRNGELWLKMIER